MEDATDAPPPVASTSSQPISGFSSASTLNRNRTHVQPGDSVLLQLPSKNIKVVKLIEGNNIVNLGKYGSFDARTQLFGQPYGLTLEIVAPPSTSASPAPAQQDDRLQQSDDTPAASTEEEPSNNKEVNQNNRSKPNGKTKLDKTQNQVLCTLRPYEELSLEEIEVDEATNENILATGAKVNQSTYITTSTHFTDQIYLHLRP